MNITKDNQWRDGKALERYMLIAPLLECKFCSNGTPILKSAVHSF